MRYINENDLLGIFADYIRNHKGDTLTKEEAVEELLDALEAADYEEIE